MKKKIVIIGLFFLLLLSMRFALKSNIPDANEKAKKEKYIHVTLPDANGNWKRVKTDIENVAEPDNFQKAMTYLFTGNEKKKLPAVFPASVDYYDITYNGGKYVEINFKKGYLELPDLQKGICETAMVGTFASFDEIDKVYLYEEGVPILAVNRNSVFGISKQDIRLSFSQEADNQIQQNVMLYFLDPAKNKLVKVERLVKRPVYERIGKTLMRELLVAPEIEGVTAILKPSMQVNEVRIRNRVCYVDFKSEFVKELSLIGVDKKLLIYSIVNTLTDLDEVEYVQFLINGEQPEQYKETEVLSTLFRKNLVFVDSQ